MAKIQLRIRPCVFGSTHAASLPVPRPATWSQYRALVWVNITSYGCVDAMFTSDLPNPRLSAAPRRILRSKPKHRLGRNRSMVAGRC